MASYIARRLLLMIPTLFGILLINFLIIQAAPGGPVERTLAQLQGLGASMGAGGAVGGGGDLASAGGGHGPGGYRGSQGLSAELVAEIEQQYGFDKPPAERFWKMITDFASFDLGDSFYRDIPVLDLVLEKLPVSLSLGLWSTLLIYLIAVPLGIRKALAPGSRFDVWSSGVIIVAYAIPGFLFALLLIILFAGGSYWQWFPMQGLTSEDFASLSAWGKLLDYAHHMVLPTVCLTLGGLATLTLFTRNSFLEELQKQYVLTARAKGADERRVLLGHVFRNAMLILIAGLPATLFGILFTGAFLIEIIFNLDGLGLLSYESVINRDYPVIFGTLFLFTLMGMLLRLLGDLCYRLVDPRIDFARSAS
ncbi:microcin C ABC transporter permease YejB [Amnimonas aquatica]|uniref:Microcin ABC transporter permease n=1 Tax=Amnimonas aquatica TaxID=2094561 RepID=A0A2P6AUV1_9GAMM|nr:microcin C ABC transporter permease YejB [Amnimonas aquatica]PQA51048.1 microcin ABC transporter permease [Amnimonas aquatica]